MEVSVKRTYSCLIAVDWSSSEAPHKNVKHLPPGHPANALDRHCCEELSIMDWPPHY